MRLRLLDGPHRVANDRLLGCTGVALSSRGAQGIIDSTADDLRRWQTQRETPEAQTVADAVGAGDGASDLRLESTMDGVSAHSDGRWQSPKVATMLVRRLEAPPEAPILSAASPAAM